MSSPGNPPPAGESRISNARTFSRDPFNALTTWGSKDDIVQLSFPGKRFFLVSNPDLIESVLQDNEDRFMLADAQRRAFRDIEDQAVTTATGERWKRLRTALAPAFARPRIDQYSTGMIQQTITHIDTWEEGEEIDLYHECRLLSLAILAETLLGIDLDGDEDIVLDATDALVARGDPRRLGQLLPDWIPTPTDRRFRRAVRELDELVERCLQDARAREREHSATAVLLAAHDRGELSMDEVRHNLVALLLAGSDTTSLGLTYTWYLLSEHPEITDALYAEYQAHNQPRPTSDSVGSGLSGITNVVAESLRLYPPTWSIMRQTTTALTLGGYRLPSGAELFLPQWVVHRDERYWDEPTRFRPDRWHEPSDRPQYAYFPFGGGPRHCIGQYVARLEMYLVLATMIGRVDLDVSTTESLTFAPTLSLRPETTISATVHRR